MIKRCNFLDLLGADSRKYHSCIITSFSFDILYFEQIVLPRLRKAGILNVNIFVDAGMLQKQLQTYTGKEYLKAKRDYSITPVHLNGAFHTKMLLAVGKSKGMLAVGSGNITASGLSNNEEIWSAFHYNSKRNFNREIFKKAAEYCSNLMEFSYGVNYKKLQWIPEHSTWYRDLLTNPVNSQVKDLNGNKIRLITSIADFSFLKHIAENYPKNPSEIKILSPYYNTSGKFLNDIIRILNPVKVHCFVDSENGTYPHRMKRDERISFSDWSILTKTEKDRRRLHAKAMQIEYDNHTIFLFGSANGTTEAFGTEIQPGINAEAMIEIQSVKKSDFFADLGIHFPDNGILELSSLPVKPAEKVKYKENFDYKIKHFELDGNNIKLVIDGDFPIDGIIKLEDADSTLILEKELKIQLCDINLKLNNEELGNLYRSSLWKNGVRISDYGILQTTSDLNKTNPDERLARFNKIRNLEIFDDLGIETFLNFLNTEKLFSHSANTPTAKPAKSLDDLVPNPVAPEEFYRNASIEDTVFSNHKNLTTLVEDFLSSLVFGNPFKEEISDNTEELAIKNEEEGSPDGTVTHKIRELSFSDGLRIKRKIDSVLDKIQTYIQSSVKNIYLPHKAPIQENQKLNLNHLNALIIGFSLLIKYFHKSFIQSSNKIILGYSDPSCLIKIENKYSLFRHEKQNGNPDGVVSYDIDINFIKEIKTDLEKKDSVHLIKINTEYIKEKEHFFFESVFWKDFSAEFITVNLGSFMYAHKKSSLQIDKEDQTLFHSQVDKLVDYSIFLLLGYFWPKKDKKLRDLLFLNIFDVFDVKRSKEEMKAFLVSKPKDLKLDEENVIEFLKLHKNYNKFGKSINANTYSKPLSPYLEKEIIYSSNYGYCFLDKVKSNDFLNLITPLGRLNTKNNIYGFTEVYISKNLKVFPTH